MFHESAGLALGSVRKIDIIALGVEYSILINKVIHIVII